MYGDDEELLEGDGMRRSDPRCGTNAGVDEGVFDDDIFDVFGVS